MPERIPVYPGRYRPSQLAIDAAITFETRAGDVVDVSTAPLISGTCGTWLLRLTNCGPDLATGAAIALIRIGYQFAFALQTDHPRGRDYCTLETDSQAVLHLSVGRGSVNLVTIHVVEGSLKQGETCTLRLGDRRQGSVGSEVFWSATTGRLLLPVDTDGSGAFQGVRGNPHDFSVVAHPEPCLLRLLGPTIAEPGEPFPLHLGIFDRNRNIIEDFAGTVTFDLPQSIEGLPESCTFTRTNRGQKIFPQVRPAVCGASDLHLGLMVGPRAVEAFRGRFGQMYPMNQRDSAYGTGPLTAVCAPELTRDALWEGIESRCTYATSGANDATPHLDALRNYLQREEHPDRFHQLTPAGLLDLSVGRCALFHCRWGEEQLPMSIRWFYEFEIPKIRFDFGWRDYGMFDEQELGPVLMQKYR